ncbi:MAG TPA: aspartyl/asparaginyl beta-hydroxylase domain-containing protein [Steroidobacteraceae bacterium]
MLSKDVEMRIRALLDQSTRAYAARDAAGAARLLHEARAMAPDHPLVLNVAGIRALDAGDAAQARDLFQRALEREDKTAALYVNLAAALRQLRLQDEEGEALEHALVLEPRNLVALLNKAALLERRGDKRSAAMVYANALKTLQPGQALPEGLRPALAAAHQAVRANAEALHHHLEQRLATVRAGQEPQGRFDHALGALLGRRRIYYPQPTQMHFPKLPALEFYPREMFPWLSELESATAEVRSEFERAFVEDQGRLEPYIAYPDGLPLDQWKELNRSTRWSALFLWRDGQPVEETLARCPRTAALLARMPMHDVPRHAPTAFFSILDAHTQIPAHTGVTNTRVIVHLPLVLPGQCRFRVGSETREWRMGEAWVFDDSIEHEAWNDSDSPRAILIFDVWNPFISDPERALIRETVPAIADYYGSGNMNGQGGI